MKFLKKHKKFYILTAVFLCILTILGTAIFRTKPSLFENILGFIITPFEKITVSVSKYIGNKIDFFNNINKIESDNIYLTQQVAELEAELKRLTLVEEQNKKLSELLELSQKYPHFPKTGSFVIGKNPSNWYNIFNIDKGTKDNVSKNMVVITNGGLVGIVLESGYSYSKVRSIIDDTSSVPVETSRTGALGTLKGNLNLMLEGLCVMEYIDQDAEIVEGEEIITSHLSSIYPPGIPIGIVREIKTDVKGLNKQAIIEPFVDFKNLDTVLVINEMFENTEDE